MSKYVLIYNGEGAGPNSTHDLKELFSTTEIYDEAPTITYTHFESNFDELAPQDVTIVLPGGSVSEMGRNLSPYQDKIKYFTDRGAKGLFICAGAYLATQHAEMFSDTYIFKPETAKFDALPYTSNTSHYFGQQLSLNVIQNYHALGPFIPNDNFIPAYHEGLELHASIGKPYSVSLEINPGLELKETHSTEIFFKGCGFERINESPSSEVVAIYKDSRHHSFFYPQSKTTKTLENLPAIIREGKFIASGVHLETCVPESKLLKFLQDGRKKYPRALPLEQGDYNSNESRNFVNALLKKTFNP
jgi:glutamine amidotransferase-like uncharacterized protein